MMIEDLQGQLLRLENVRGKDLVIDFHPKHDHPTNEAQEDSSPSKSEDTCCENKPIRWAEKRKTSNRAKPVSVSETAKSVSLSMKQPKGATAIKQLIEFEKRRQEDEETPYGSEKLLESLQSLSDYDPIMNTPSQPLTSNYFDKAKEKIMSAIKKGQVQ